MGKQINYWLGYEEFLQIAQKALDCGCVIIKPVSGKLVYGQALDIVTEKEHRYYFYVPEAGELSGKTIPFEKEDSINGYTAEGNTVIHVGFSFRNDEKKELIRNRLFVISGYYDSDGEYVSRPECVTKTYNRLVRVVKRIAPYIELTDTYVSVKEEDYLQEKEWKHKEYISPEFLDLKLSQNFRLRV